MQTFDGLDEFERAVGTHLGHSRWRTVTQEQVDLFADTTDDHQWIHVDVERAERESPYGTTIAHGNLTLAMIDGFRESAESWRELLLDLRCRGLKQDPKLAIGDGALGSMPRTRRAT